MSDLAKYIDHTLLSPLATLEEIKRLCQETIDYGFASACIPPYFVENMRKEFGQDLKIATVIGFPFGYSHYEAKKKEIEVAIQAGVNEIDFVANIAAIKIGDWEYLKKEMEICLPIIQSADKSIKVIIESGILTEEEIITTCQLYSKFNIDYIKTSTGYAEKGALEEDIILIKNHIPSNIKIKASGGIRDKVKIQKMIDLGAERIGTSSGLKIIT